MILTEVIHVIYTHTHTHTNTCTHILIYIHTYIYIYYYALSLHINTYINKQCIASHVVGFNENISFLSSSSSFLHYSVTAVTINLIWHISCHPKSRDDILSIWKATDKTLSQTLSLYITVSFFIISWRQIHNPQWFHGLKALLLFTLSFFPSDSEKKKKWFAVKQKENRNLRALSIFLSP